ncbi:MAG TPA: DUF4118 domain-containing protein, partial [Dissulfurispiraceae bacterium]|nr:DUF4118 domain-containing protein [Dissulfurispiraceae bacterium]
ARSRNVTKIIIGKPTHPRWKDKIFGSMLDEIVRGSGDIEVYVISGDVPAPAPVAKPRAVPRKTPALEWVISIFGIALCTGIALLMFPYFTRVDVAMIYILGVVVIASRTGSAPSLLASLLSVAAFDFFFVPPYYTFAVSDVKYFITFIVMFIVAFVTSRLTLRVREQADAARRRERSTAALYRLSRELVNERGIEQLSEIASKHITEVFSQRAVVLMPDRQGDLIVPGTDSKAVSLDDRELSVAQWAFSHRQSAGRGTDTLPGGKGLYVPLVAASRTVGVIGLMSDDSEPFDPEHIHVLENFAHQAAMALERAFLAEDAQRAQLKAETESMRNTLLSSLSHDLRTPLAAITGASTSLLDQGAVLTEQGRCELTQTIIEEAEHLNRIVRNVLDMTRIESGAITVRKEWQQIEEIVGTVLNRLSDKLVDHPLSVSIPADLPLAPFDPLLIEQVLMNLLENAIKYTPAGTQLELAASVGDDSLLVELADHGPGIRPGEEVKIFDKFVHGPATAGGIGLGLTICRAIVTAHGGRTWAENRQGGGAVFRFTLPIAEQPPIVETDE